MPQPTYPPTPGSSTDIKARDGVLQFSSLHLSFELPPPALHHDGPGASCAVPCSSHCSVSATQHPCLAYTPSLPAVQPVGAIKQRRRSSRDVKEESFSLPPPPTRSRKIIQMRPRLYDDPTAQGSSDKSSDNMGQGAKGVFRASKMVSGASSSAMDKSGKKKTPSVTSAAGRKIARKTAHSLIERRRRSKMNEEFGVLKNMIPACTGEMHKLAILQASIEYIRYLEECVDKLKTQHGESQSRHASETRHHLPSIRDFHPTVQDDVDMTDSDTTPHLFIDQTDQQQQQLSTASPPQRPQLSPSTTFKHHAHGASAATSPVFTPQQTGGDRYGPSRAPVDSHSTTCAATRPQSHLDHEATTALMMLNRGKQTSNSRGRGLSVSDLLTT